MTIRDEGVMSIDSRFIPCLEMIALYSVFLFLAFRSNVSEKRAITPLRTQVQDGKITKLDIVLGYF